MNTLSPSLALLNDTVAFGNSFGNYFAAIIVFAGAFLTLKLFQRMIVVRFEALARRTATSLDDAFISIVRGLKPPFYGVLAAYFALRFLTLSPFMYIVVDAAALVVVVYEAVRAAQALIEFALQRRVQQEGEAGEVQGPLMVIGKVAKGVLWAVGALFILSNLGINVNSLIAGLGIGGIAIALALQQILGDLFSSFAIYFDKPFVAGDFIVVGEHMGVVERIGIKTTRIRALQGEEIVVSNQELTSTRVQNFKRMQERRVVFHFGVVYDTAAEVLKIIPTIVQEAVASVPHTRFDRAHFMKFDDSSLTFEAVYYFLSGDYNAYMDAHQAVHLKLKERFDAERISFAFPTRTIHMVS